MTTTHYHSYNNYVNQQRKRRYSEDEHMSDAQTISSRSQSEQQRPMHTLREGISSSTVKRHKGDIQQRSAMDNMLGQLTQVELANIVFTLYSRHPELRQEVMEHLPAPTFQSATDTIKNMLKRLNDSFPYNRNGESRNAYTFSRVRVTLVELIDTIKQYCQYFITSHIIFTPTSFDFLNFATELAHALPDWDEQEHNLLKYDLYLDLNNYWARAIQSAAHKLREGETYGSQTMTEWTKQLVYHNNRTKGMFSSALNEFTSRLGFLITPSRYEAAVCKDAAVENNMVHPVFSSPQIVGYADGGR